VQKTTAPNQMAAFNKPTNRSSPFTRPP
jgi:hypothetical protein